MELTFRIKDDSFIELIEKALYEFDDLTTGERLDLQEVKEGKCNCTLRVLKLLKMRFPNEVSVYKWLRSGEIILPTLPKRERNPELEARIQKLKKEQEQREYDRMTSNVDVVQLHRQRNKFGSFQQDLAILNRQLIIIFNTLLTVVCSFLFGFYSVQFVSPSSDYALRVAVGLLFAIVVFLSDILHRKAKMAYNLTQKQNEEKEAALSKRFLFTKMLNEYYKEKILPVESCINFDLYCSLPLLDCEFSCNPTILFLGQHSVGKTSMIRFLLNTDYPGMRIAPEPSNDIFNIIIYGNDARIIPSNIMVNNTNFPFPGLTQFSNQCLKRCVIASCPVPLLKHVTIIDTPGILENSLQSQGPTEFEQMIRYFAGKVDRILLMFDALRFDLSESMNRLLYILQPFEDKILLILNKGDTCDPIALSHVRSTLIWSMSRKLHTVEMPKVYVGSFWDKPLRNPVHQQLFQADLSRLFEELRCLPRTTNIRRLKDVLKRANQVMLFATLTNKMHNMRYFAGCIPRMKKRTLAKIVSHEIYPKLINLLHLQTADLPTRDLIYNLMLKDIWIFKKVSKKDFQQLSDFLHNDMTHLLQVLRAEVPEKIPCGRLQDPLLNRDYENYDWNAVNEEAEKQGWRSEFHLLGPKNGLLHAVQLTEALQKSGLPRLVLDQIWRLIDQDNDNMINEDQFCLVKYLINRTLRGRPVPSQLSNCMLPLQSQDNFCACKEAEMDMEESISDESEPIQPCFTPQNQLSVLQSHKKEGEK
ncbi:EH domain-containing protein 1 [Trichinella pseudospiralis]|uniref:EH domain-containing protein 1 n=3 Tax=Trichinella pseudospiralis TaxID=6337 RepID=A0A0V1JIQ7_TRIPS|nr:EH domain-containing protein 1 [Trichinella pseudospiralis]KRZ34733.1 EH domain-containing protein 1 [Trichinella pseudospiralis]